MKEQLKKIAQVGAGVSLAYLLLRGCDDVNTVYRTKQQELDRLCGLDKSACAATTDTVCMPDFGTSGLSCAQVTNYATPTPVRK